MNNGRFRFDCFTLDIGERILRRDDVVLDVSNRYFDALVLLISDAGGLISKDRFMDEVWRGVPVTDEALTQCIKTLRRQLSDDAANPRLIETVPKHGYRFIAPVLVEESEKALPSTATATATSAQSTISWRQFFLLGGAGVVGGGIAGLIGGIFYGFVGAAQPLQPGMGATSIVLVLTSITVLIALVGAAGVSFGIASAGFGRCNAWQWNIGGGAFGGLIVGGIVKLLGLDAFNLLLGQSPTNITGAIEGGVLGGAVGFGVWLGGRRAEFHVWPAAMVSGAAGITITALGGKLLGGSMHSLAEVFPQSRLRLDQIGIWFGEPDFGPISQMVTGGIEGMLFGTCVAAAILLARRQLEIKPMS